MPEVPVRPGMPPKACGRGGWLTGAGDTDWTRSPEQMPAGSKDAVPSSTCGSDSDGGLIAGPITSELVGMAVEDRFTAPASIEEQYHYAWSVVACLPAAMGDPETAATGAVLRPATLRRYALEAGFQELEVLPVDAGMLRLYRLRA